MTATLKMSDILGGKLGDMVFDSYAHENRQIVEITPTYLGATDAMVLLYTAGEKVSNSTLAEYAVEDGSEYAMHMGMTQYGGTVEEAVARWNDHMNALNCMRQPMEIGR